MLYASRLSIVAVTLVALTFGATHAAVNYFGLTFPDTIAGTRIGPVTDFEETNPGLGYSVRYDKPGWIINVYIYDDRLGPIPGELDADVVKSQLEQARGDIVALQRSGSYTNVSFNRSYVLRDAAGKARFLCADYTFARKDMGNVDSFLCLTSWNGQFVKFRLTTGERASSAREAAAFVNAWRGVLWPK
ncbi:MAG TPA: hypothetical protein VGG01_04220 [Xanthobacteraceae bacterium]